MNFIKALVFGAVFLQRLSLPLLKRMAGLFI